MAPSLSGASATLLQSKLVSAAAAAGKPSVSTASWCRPSTSTTRNSTLPSVLRRNGESWTPPGTTSRKLFRRGKAPSRVGADAQMLVLHDQGRFLDFESRRRGRSGLRQEIQVVSVVSGGRQIGAQKRQFCHHQVAVGVFGVRDHLRGDSVARTIPYHQASRHRGDGVNATGRDHIGTEPAERIEDRNCLGPALVGARVDPRRNVFKRCIQERSGLLLSGVEVVVADRPGFSVPGSCSSGGFLVGSPALFGGNGLVGVALEFEVSFWELSRGQLMSDEQAGSNPKGRFADDTPGILSNGRQSTIWAAHLAHVRLLLLQLGMEQRRAQDFGSLGTHVLRQRRSRSGGREHQWVAAGHRMAPRHSGPFLSL